MPQKSTSTAVVGILRSLKAAHSALGREAAAIARLAAAFAATLQGGGRVLYIGAGTSGRLGALDAAELLPTFGLGPNRVAARIAGGRRALWEAVEGAEDDVAAARRAVGGWRAGPKDLVTGLSASGATPWTVAGLLWARERGAATGAVACRPATPLLEAADHPVCVAVGPEWLEGSTRMAAGGAQRAALVAISTAGAAALGAVTEGRMTRVRPTNHKLRARAARLVADLGQVGPERAADLLGQAGWRVEVAILRARGVALAEAEKLLEEATLAEILATL